MSVGVSEAAQELIMGSWRPSTVNHYESFLRRWKDYCVGLDTNWMCMDVRTCLNFLAFLYGQGLGYSSINTARSALSSVVTLMDGRSVGSHPLVKKLVRGVFVLRPPSPRYDRIWDVNVVLNHQRSQEPVDKVDFRLLSHNFVTLLLIVSSQRCQTLCALSAANVSFAGSHVSIGITGLLKTSRPGHQIGSLKLSEYAEDRRLCVVTYLREYLKRASELEPPGRELLFVTTRPPFNAAATTTVARWTVETLGKAGVDTSVFKAHSTRSASVSAAKGSVPLELLLAHAGWSSATSFARHYDKPVEGPVVSTAILNAKK